MSRSASVMYVGLLDNVEISHQPTLPAGFEIRPADCIEKRILECSDSAWVVVLYDKEVAPRDQEEGPWYYRRLRRLMRAVHIVLRTCGVGGISIIGEFALYQPRGNSRPVRLCGAWLRYRKAWGNPNERDDIAPYKFSLDVVNRLNKFFSPSIWAPESWDDLYPLFQFADAVYRTYDRDRFVDYYLCMEALIVPEEYNERVIAQEGGAGKAFYRRGAQLLAWTNEEGAGLTTPVPNEVFGQYYLKAVYKLRSAILHGDTKKNQKWWLHLLGLDPEADESWTILARTTENYARHLIRTFFTNGKIEIDKRKQFWQDRNDYWQGNKLTKDYWSQKRTP